MSSVHTPRDVTLRPLNKGMVLNQPAQLLPPGSMLELRNFQVRELGLQRRGGYDRAFRETRLFSIHRPVIANVLFWGTTGTKNLVITRRGLFLFDDEVLTDLMPMALSATTAETRLTGTLTNEGDGFWKLVDAEVSFFQRGATPGDVVSFYDNDNKRYAEAVVYSVADTDLALVNAPELVAGPCTYSVQQGFEGYPDWCQEEGKLYIADNSERRLMVYDGTTFTELPSGSDQPTYVNATALFGYRLWAAGMDEGASSHRQRVRWTDVTNKTTFPVASYVDLVGPRTGISRLMPLGNLLVAYFQDAVFFGRPTNIVGLPYDFTPFDTGGVGLVGQRAVTSWLDAHWFVGQDDIYAFSATRALEKIGTAVLRDTIQGEDYLLEQTIVTADPIHERILFLFVRSDDLAPDLWAFYYKTTAWSKESYDGSGVFTYREVILVTWLNIDAHAGIAEMAWESNYLKRPWRAMFETIEGVMLYTMRNDVLQRYTPGQIGDYSPRVGEEDIVVSIPTALETGDMDLDVPYMDKTLTQVTVKLGNLVNGGDAQNELSFDVSVATNREQQVKQVGTLRIPHGKDEGKINFRSTGAQFRVRLQSTSQVVDYIITEIGLRVRLRGRETRYGR